MLVRDYMTERVLTGLLSKPAFSPVDIGVLFGYISNYFILLQVDSRFRENDRRKCGNDKRETRMTKGKEKRELVFLALARNIDEE